MYKLLITLLLSISFNQSFASETKEETAGTYAQWKRVRSEDPVDNLSDIKKAADRGHYDYKGLLQLAAYGDAKDYKYTLACLVWANATFKDVVVNFGEERVGVVSWLLSRTDGYDETDFGCFGDLKEALLEILKSAGDSSDDDDEGETALDTKQKQIAALLGGDTAVA